MKKYFPTTISRDLMHLCCGEKLGSGMNREVYVNALDPTTVLKFEIRGGHFQNITEFERWQEYGETEMGKWLAPIVSVSRNGIVVVQKRTTPIPIESFPDEIPSFFRDVKLANFGMLDGRVVCHDYGISFFLNLRRGKRKVQKDLKEGIVW